MTWDFGDGYDAYALPADATVGYWDATVATSLSIQPGRFAGSNSFRWNSITNSQLAKTSGVNDPVHHFCVAFQQSATLTGSSSGLSITLYDAAAAQCTITFKSDGSIVLFSGGTAGALQATYPGAVTLVNTWYHFEFEVSISNTAGTFAVRRNGATTDSFAQGGLNTRAGSAVNQANRITISQAVAVNAQFLDDFYWRSGSSVAWMGDIKCGTRRATQDAVAPQFSHSPATLSQALVTPNTNTGITANLARAYPFTATATGLISATVQVQTAPTAARMKFALYDATGVLMATSNELVNPVVGVNAVTFSVPPMVVSGRSYYLAYNQDFAVVCNVLNMTSVPSITMSYSSFPAPNVTSSWVPSGSVYIPGLVIVYSTPANASFVDEAAQDAATTYVSSDTPGAADLYTISPLTTVPLRTIAVTTRGLMQKSDAGARSAAIQLKSGGTTVGTPSLTLTATWQWAWRTDANDPATGAAWTLAAVNAATVGPTVTG